MEAFGVKLEVVDERLHRGLHLGARRRGEFAAGQHVARLDPEPGHSLTDDAGRLAHLGHATEVAVVAVTVAAHRHPEVEFVIAFVRLRAAQVPGKARAAHHDAREAPVLDVVLAHHADIDVALLEDAVLGQKPVDIVKHAGKGLGPGVDVVDERGRQVLMHAAGAEIGGMKPRPAGALVKDHELFALLEAPERRGQRAHIHRLCGDVEEVVEHAPDLAEEHPDERGTARDGGAGQLFDRQTPGMFLVHRRDIVEPVEIGQVLQIGAAFHQLFGAAMQEPDMGVATLNDLAVKLEHKAENAMCRRVLRAEVDVEIANALFARLEIDRTVVIAVAPDVAVHHDCTSVVWAGVDAASAHKRQSGPR